MIISKPLVRNICGIRKNTKNYQNIPIKLRYDAHDVFVKSQDKDFVQYLEKYNQNPNTAFLYNPNLTYEEKLKLLANSDTIFKAQDLTAITGMKTSAWLSESFFDIDFLAPSKADNKKAAPIKVIDTLNPKNAISLERIKNLPESVVTPEVFRKYAKMDLTTYKRYCKEGRIEKIQLPHKNTGVLTNTELVDKSSQKNIEAVKRHQALIAKNSSYYNSSSINVLELGKLGFGTPKELAGLVKSGILDGDIKRIGKNQNGQNVIQVTVNLSTTKSKCILKTLKDDYCKTIEKLAEENKIDLSSIEDAILSGNIVAVDRMFDFDSMTPTIDMTNPKNIAAIDKLCFEKLIKEELLNQTKQDIPNKSELEYKMAWLLASKTQEMAREIFKQNNLEDIANSIQKTKELIANPKHNSKTREALEESLNELLAKEKEELSKNFNAIWSNIGTQEFYSAIQKARTILKPFDMTDLSLIQDVDTFLNELIN